MMKKFIALILLCSTAYGSYSSSVTISDSTNAAFLASVSSGGALKVDASGAPIPVSQSGAWTVGRTWSLLNSTDSVNAVQSGTWNLGNITGSISLPTGAATATLQGTGNTSLGTIATNIPAKGQALSAASMPVVIASDQSAIPVSVSSIPIATGAATSALQTTGNASLASIDSKITAVNTGAVVVSSSALPAGASTESTLSSMSAKIPASLGAKTGASSLSVVPNSDTAFPVTGTFWQTTQPVSAASLPLPSGASTSAKQPAIGTAGTPSSDVITVQGATSMTALKVDGSSVTQPVSGTVTANAGSGTFSVSAASLPLPTGASTESTLAKLTQTQGSTTSGQSGPLSQGAVTTSAPTYITAQTSPLSLNTSGGLRVDGSGVTQPVSASSLPLPTGAATSALQTTGNNSLSSIDGKTPALGQALAAASVPVVLTAAQVTTLTPLSTVAATQSGTWNVNNVSGTVSLPTGAATSAKQPALGTAGSASADVISVQGVASMTALKVDGSAVTQPVSAASLPLPAGAATSALQTTTNTSLSTISGQLPTSLGAKTTANSLSVNIASDQTVTTTDAANGSVTGGAAGTKTELIGAIYNTALPSLTNGQQAAVQVDASGRLIMGTSAATIGSVGVNAGTNLIGKVGIDQTTPGTTNLVAAGQNGTWNITNVSGTVSLPTGASTAAKQPALGTAGTPSTDVITVQGATSMTALKVDGSAVTQPVSVATAPIGGATGNSPGSSTVSTVATITAPANAMGFILQNLDTSTANIRWRIGATATTTSGQQLQPGRDTVFIPCKANVSIVAESGTQNYDIQWVVQ